MPDYPPYMMAYGNIPKILNAIRDAKTPSRFTQDYLDTVLGFSGGGARPFIGFAKRLGLLAQDGTPTDLYDSFRNPAKSEFALATAIKNGYEEVYRRNEYAHHLDADELTGLIMEMTGLESGSGTLRAVVKSFQSLCEMANFDPAPLVDVEDNTVDEELDSAADSSLHELRKAEERGTLRLSYDITLNLPNSTDPAVFNAIFRALKEQIL